MEVRSLYWDFRIQPTVIAYSQSSTGIGPKTATVSKVKGNSDQFFEGFRKSKKKTKPSSTSIKIAGHHHHWRPPEKIVAPPCLSLHS